MADRDYGLPGGSAGVSLPTYSSIPAPPANVPALNEDDLAAVNAFKSAVAGGSTPHADAMMRGLEAQYPTGAITDDQIFDYIANNPLPPSGSGQREEGVTPTTAPPGPSAADAAKAAAGDAGEWTTSMGRQAIDLITERQAGPVSLEEGEEPGVAHTPLASRVFGWLGGDLSTEGIAETFGKVSGVLDPIVEKGPDWAASPAIAAQAGLGAVSGINEYLLDFTTPTNLGIMGGMNFFEHWAKKAIAPKVRLALEMAQLAARGKFTYDMGRAFAEYAPLAVEAYERGDMYNYGREAAKAAASAVLGAQIAWSGVKGAKRLGREHVPEVLAEAKSENTKINKGLTKLAEKLNLDEYTTDVGTKVDPRVVTQNRRDIVEIEKLEKKLQDVNPLIQKGIPSGEAAAESINADLMRLRNKVDLQNKWIKTGIPPEGIVEKLERGVPKEGVEPTVAQPAEGGPMTLGEAETHIERIGQQRTAIIDKAIREQRPFSKEDNTQIKTLNEALKIANARVKQLQSEQPIPTPTPRAEAPSAEPARPTQPTPRAEAPTAQPLVPTPRERLNALNIKDPLDASRAEAIVDTASRKGDAKEIGARLDELSDPGLRAEVRSIALDVYRTPTPPVTPTAVASEVTPAPPTARQQASGVVPENVAPEVVPHLRSGQAFRVVRKNGSVDVMRKVDVGGEAKVEWLRVSRPETTKERKARKAKKSDPVRTVTADPHKPTIIPAPTKIGAAKVEAISDLDWNQAIGRRRVVVEAATKGSNQGEYFLRDVDTQERIPGFYGDRDAAIEKAKQNEWEIPQDEVRPPTASPPKATDLLPEPTVYEHSSVQVDVPNVQAQQIKTAVANSIPKEMLAGDGLEVDPHVTVRYGLETQSPQAVESMLRGKGPAEARVGKLDVFEADSNHPDTDVVILRVNSPKLASLNKQARGLPGTDTYPTYEPHITLAYVAKGQGKAAVAKIKAAKGMPQAGDPIYFRDASFSNRAGERTHIPMATTDVPPAVLAKEAVKSRNKQIVGLVRSERGLRRKPNKTYNQLRDEHDPHGLFAKSSKSLYLGEVELSAEREWVDPSGIRRVEPAKVGYRFVNPWGPNKGKEFIAKESDGYSKEGFAKLFGKGWNSGKHTVKEGEITEVPDATARTNIQPRSAPPTAEPPLEPSASEAALEIEPPPSPGKMTVRPEVEAGKRKERSAKGSQVPLERKLGEEDIAVIEARSGIPEGLQKLIDSEAEANRLTPEQASAIGNQVARHAQPGVPIEAAIDAARDAAIDLATKAGPDNAAPFFVEAAILSKLRPAAKAMAESAPTQSPGLAAEALPGQMAAELEVSLEGKLPTSMQSAMGIPGLVSRFARNVEANEASGMSKMEAIRAARKFTVDALSEAADNLPDITAGQAKAFAKEVDSAIGVSIVSAQMDGALPKTAAQAKPAAKPPTPKQEQSPAAVEAPKPTPKTTPVTPTPRVPVPKSEHEAASEPAPTGPPPEVSKARTMPSLAEARVKVNRVVKDGVPYLDNSKSGPYTYEAVHGSVMSGGKRVPASWVVAKRSDGQAGMQIWAPFRINHNKRLVPGDAKLNILGAKTFNDKYKPQTGQKTEPAAAKKEAAPEAKKTGQRSVIIQKGVRPSGLDPEGNPHPVPVRIVDAKDHSTIIKRFPNDADQGHALAMEYIKANRENYKLRAGGSTAQPPKKSLRAGKTPTPPKTSPGKAKSSVGKEPAGKAPNEQIYDALLAAEPQKGLPVYAGKLRARVPGLEKKEFDKAMLDLWSKRRVHLHEHDDVNSLSAKDKSDLVTDGKRYYVAAAWRSPETKTPAPPKTLVEAKFSDIKEAMEYIKANRENYKLRAGGSTAQPPKKSLRAGKTPTPPKPSPGPPKTLVEAKFSDIKEKQKLQIKGTDDFDPGIPVTVLEVGKSRIKVSQKIDTGQAIDYLEKSDFDNLDIKIVGE
jgi:hypothetical protein